MAERGRNASGVKYLGLRKGRKWWCARIYWVDERTGKAREKQITYQADSKHLALVHREKEAEAARAGTTVGAPSKRWREVADAWFATITVRSTRVSWGSHLRALNARFGDHKIDKVTTRELQAFLDAMPGSAAYVNGRRDVAVHVFDHGIRLGAVTTNHARDVKRRSSRVTVSELEEPPKRALTVDEALQVVADLEVNEQDIYPLVITQLVLGCRFGEASALRREDVNLETGIVTIRRTQWNGAVGPTKGRYARRAALPLDARALLRAHLARMDAEQWPDYQLLVFPRPPFGNRPRHSNHWSIATAIYKLQRAYERCGIDVKGGTHVWRHTLSTLADSLASEQLVRSVMGHKSKAVHERYHHAHEADVIALADAIGRKLPIKTGSKTGTSTGGKPSGGKNGR